MKYESATEKQEIWLEILRKSADELFNIFRLIESREMEQAKINLEQSISWATKAILITSSQLPSSNNSII